MYNNIGAYKMGRRAKTDEVFKKEVYDLVGDEYTFLETYIKAGINIKVRHNKCSHEYEVRPNNFLGLGRRCPKCENRKRKTTEEFKEEIYEIVKDEYTVIGEYINAKTGVEIKHEYCGNTYKVVPNDILRGTRCPYCNGIGKIRKNTDTFKGEVYFLEEGEYEVIGEYTLNNEKIEMKHVLCGGNYEVTPKNFLQGSRCPMCRESKGETYIRKYLERNNIEYEREKEFKDLINERPLRFDFYLPEYNILIEFDGKQHFEYIPLFHTYDKYLRQQENDRIKNKYCEDKNIPLLRIPYTQLGNEGAIIQDYILEIEYRESVKYKDNH